jgi:hypothetical protein
MFEGENQGATTVDNAREWESFENISDPEDGGDGQNHPERVPKLYIFYKGPLAIAENPQIQRLHIYPNPANNTRVFVNLNSSDPAVISIYDLTGKEIKTCSVDQTLTTEMDINDLHQGIYIMKALQDNQVYTQKLIVN